jgi:hypothetical protein
MASITFGSFKTMLLATLGAVEGTTYGDDLLWNAACLAEDAILPWVPNQKFVELTSGSGPTLAVPSDCFNIEAVVDGIDGTVLERVTLIPGRKRPVAGTTKVSSYDWFEYPKGYINFGVTPVNPNVQVVDENGVASSGSARPFTVYYQGAWEKPESETDDTFILPVPDVAITGMLYWAAAHCLIPSSNVSSQIRQFNTRVDSGTPVDNVLQESAAFLRKIFIEEMNRLPKYRGVAV